MPLLGAPPMKVIRNLQYFSGPDADVNLNALDLYLPDGVYRYRAGWNASALVATAMGCALAWGGWVFPVLKPLYDYAWFVGFGVAFAVYVLIMERPR